MKIAHHFVSCGVKLELQLDKFRTDTLAWTEINQYKFLGYVSFLDIGLFANIFVPWMSLNLFIGGSSWWGDSVQFVSI